MSLYEMCNKCGKLIDIEKDVCSNCSNNFKKKSPQNLPKANAYSLLAEVRADIRKMIDDASENFRYNDSMRIVSKLKNINNKLQKISERLSKHGI